MRDATEYEIASEPTCVLEGMVAGDYDGCTWTTVQLCIEELNRRGIPTNSLERAVPVKP